MAELTITVGLPASGKTTWAKQHENDNTIVLSSDGLRKELLGSEQDQSNNELVFNTLYKRAKEYLSNGKNVIIDATNVSMKDRRRTLSQFQKFDVKKNCILFATPFEICIERDKTREKSVGKDVIMKFLHRFEVPMEFEGFDKVEIVEPNESYYISFTQEQQFNQLNPHHAYDLLTHERICKEVLRLLHLLVKDRDIDDRVMWAGRYHDIGKLFTQTIDNEGIAHYYGHANVGAYVMLCEGTHDRETIFYINYHMMPFNWKEQKTIDKYIKLFGKERCDNLWLLHKVDEFASGRDLIL